MKKGIFNSHLPKVPVNCWDLRVVSEQAGGLNERFAFLAGISVVSQLLLGKMFPWWISPLLDVSFCSRFLEGVFGWLIFTFQRWVSRW